MSFREDYRQENVGPRYSGTAHAWGVSITCLATVGAALAQLHQVLPWEWLTLPLTFLVANAAEYFGHRGPMHHRRRGLGLIYQRHTLEHHRFFTHRDMAIDSRRDFRIVLFPPLLLAFFLGGIAAPLGLGVFRTASPNCGWLFLATAVGYYLSYEWLHLSYHLPPNSWVGRRALVRRLRQHHCAHHDPALMGRANFNITFPLCDWLMRTGVSVGSPWKSEAGEAR